VINKNEDTTLQNFFMSLEQKLRTDEFRKLKKKAEYGPHPTDDMLFNYVLGWMDDEDAEIIENHFLLCKICAEEVSRIRLIDSESNQALLDWANSSPKKPQIIEKAIRMMKFFKNTPGEMQKFVLEIGAKKLATLTLLSKEKNESDEDKKLLSRLWEVIKPSLGSLSSGVPQTRYAESSESEQIDFIKFDEKEVSGAMNIVRIDNQFLLSGYYSLRESDKILILNLPDSYIVLDPKKAVHVFPGEEKIDGLEIEKDGNDVEFRGVVLKKKSKLNAISYEISDSYFDDGEENEL
jgi:hypothetical protein